MAPSIACFHSTAVVVSWPQALPAPSVSLTCLHLLVVLSQVHDAKNNVPWVEAGESISASTIMGEGRTAGTCGTIYTAGDCNTETTAT